MLEIVIVVLPVLTSFGWCLDIVHVNTNGTINEHSFKRIDYDTQNSKLLLWVLKITLFIDTSPDLYRPNIQSNSEVEI